MRVHDSVFFGIIFFLIGVLLASLRINFWIILISSALSSAVFLCINFLQSKPDRRRIILGILILFISVGALYYFSFENYKKIENKIIYNKTLVFKGVVSEILENTDTQKMAVALQAPYKGNILINLKPYQGVSYGDLIKFEGKIQKPEGTYAMYLEKNDIYGISNYPKTDLLAIGQGNRVKASLISIKESIISAFQQTLSQDKSSFLAGLTLGDQREFSKDFKNSMSQSGTTHLVALSGYNISIVILAIGLFLGYFFSRQTTFFLSLMAILGFVVMTGASASIVRAAIMGGIVLLATRANRIYSFRNAFAIAAFVMVLFNPKILKFDIGFQLSFLALLGMVYLAPAIVKFLKIEDMGSFLSWKENLLNTVSAQLAVAPLLIVSFGKFSLISLLSNVLILSAIPITMALGFILGFLGWVSGFLAQIFAWLVNIPLSYELFIINYFGKINFFQINEISPFSVIIYYASLILFIMYPKLKSKYAVIKYKPKESRNAKYGSCGQ